MSDDLPVGSPASTRKISSEVGAIEELDAQLQRMKAARKSVKPSKEECDLAARVTYLMVRREVLEIKATETAQASAGRREQLREHDAYLRSKVDHLRDMQEKNVRDALAPLSAEAKSNYKSIASLLDEAAENARRQSDAKDDDGTFEIDTERQARYAPTHTRPEEAEDNPFNLCRLLNAASSDDDEDAEKNNLPSCSIVGMPASLHKRGSSITAEKPNKRLRNRFAAAAKSIVRLKRAPSRVLSDSSAHELANLFNTLKSNSYILVKTEQMMDEDGNARVHNTVVALSPTNAYNLRLALQTPPGEPHITYTSRQWVVKHTLMEMILDSKLDVDYFADMQVSLENVYADFCRTRDLTYQKDEEIARMKSKIKILEDYMNKKISTERMFKLQTALLAGEVYLSMKEQAPASSQDGSAKEDVYSRVNEIVQSLQNRESETSAALQQDPATPARPNLSMKALAEAAGLSGAHENLLRDLKTRIERRRRRIASEARAAAMERAAMEGEDSMSSLNTIFHFGAHAYATLRDVLKFLPPELLRQVTDMSAADHIRMAESRLVICPCCRFEFDPSKPASEYRDLIAQRRLKAVTAFAPQQQVVVGDGKQMHRGRGRQLKPTVPENVASSAEFQMAGNSEGDEFLIMSLQEQIKELEGQISTLKKRLVDTEAELEVHVSRTNTLQERLNNIDNDHSQKLKELNTLLDKYADDLDAARDENDKLKSDNATIGRKLEAVQKAANDAFEEVRMIRELEAKIAAMTRFPQDGSSGVSMEDLARTYYRRFLEVSNQVRKLGGTPIETCDVLAGGEEPIPRFAEESTNVGLRDLIDFVEGSTQTVPKVTNAIGTQFDKAEVADAAVQAVTLKKISIRPPADFGDDLPGMRQHTYSLLRDTVPEELTTQLDVFIKTLELKEEEHASKMKDELGRLIRERNHLKEIQEKQSELTRTQIENLQSELARVQQKEKESAAQLAELDLRKTSAIGVETQVTPRAQEPEGGEGTRVVVLREVVDPVTGEKKYVKIDPASLPHLDLGALVKGATRFPSGGDGDDGQSSASRSSDGRRARLRQLDEQIAAREKSIVSTTDLQELEALVRQRIEEQYDSFYIPLNMLLALISSVKSELRSTINVTRTLAEKRYARHEARQRRVMAIAQVHLGDGLASFDVGKDLWGNRKPGFSLHGRPGDETELQALPLTLFNFVDPEERPAPQESHSAPRRLSCITPPRVCRGRPDDYFALREKEEGVQQNVASTSPCHKFTKRRLDAGTSRSALIVKQIAARLAAKRIDHRLASSASDDLKGDETKLLSFVRDHLRSKVETFEYMRAQEAKRRRILSKMRIASEHPSPSGDEVVDESPPVHPIFAADETPNRVKLPHIGGSLPMNTRGALLMTANYSEVRAGLRQPSFYGRLAARVAAKNQTKLQKLTDGAL